MFVVESLSCVIISKTVTFNTLPVTVAILDTTVSYICFTQHVMIHTFNVRETSLTIAPC
jgi:hypothetical protein